MRTISQIYLVGLLALSSCVKCTTCRNECYLCGSSSKPSCSTDFATKGGWESVRSNLQNTQGCTLVEPTESKKICDEHLDNLTYLYERANYYCNN